jgi:hypothetical protein
VKLAQRDRLEDQEVEGAGEEFGLVGHVFS